ncbi:bifunctional phosphoribosylaminoimidazolecarboxamide formyltransferase/IMP cyclohydrolase [bacterium]|nr:MAG: bifunctional phosphoribosylaminoimidazolecarboxamide formyltransferase/IMP cyclohydrolase [bacterium]
MKRALLSVTDKSGIVEFAQGLSELGYELLSTGGTAKALREAGLAVTDVSEATGFPEMLDGRVKTLHPKIHGGLLGDLRLEGHRNQMAEAEILPIEIVGVNLYAFEKTVTGEHQFEEAVESIDIGGPGMVRSAAKNHANVYVVVDPTDYPTVLATLRDAGNGMLRRELAAKAFRHTAYYDSMIARYLSDEGGFTETLTLGYRHRQTFRYGENPHQTAALYVDPLGRPGIGQAEQLWGKELSYNNLLDADGAWELACDLPLGGVAIIKHSNPCGAAAAGSLAESYNQAREADPISAFGGIAALHGVVDEAAALAMTAKGNFLEVVVAAGFDEAALDVFRNRSGWGKDVRLLVAPIVAQSPSLSVRAIRGGVLVQQTDEQIERPEDWTFVTALKPTEAQLTALALNWSIVRHVKSNAIVVGNETRLLGVGAGQMNRVQSVRLALEQAGEGARGAVLASDAFFPFPDSIETAAAAGIAAIVQPGGSKKDPDVIAKCDELGIAMALTGARHFRH